ncbi:MAG TPA: hypothetical protein VHS56_12155 [Candidatus Cybelea sp.]|nr:hypothetical protein [Candidatus Cybelea sp.]
MQRPRFLRWLLALLGAPWFSAARAAAQNTPADLIVIGATIHSVDNANASPISWMDRDWMAVRRISAEELGYAAS